jgi:ATP-dependent Clp protease ATP-binding subunit ClpA
MQVVDGCKPSPSPNVDDIFASNGWLRPELLEESTAKALQRAVCWATDTRWDSIRTPHLFMGLLSTTDRRVSEWCRMIGADADSLLLQFAALFTRSKKTPMTIVRLNREFLSENAIGVLRAAAKRARRCKHSVIRMSDLLVALFSPAGGIVAGCFADVGFSPERLVAMAVAAEGSDDEDCRVSNTVS